MAIAKKSKHINGVDPEDVYYFNTQVKPVAGISDDVKQQWAKRLGLSDDAKKTKTTTAKTPAKKK